MHLKSSLDRFIVSTLSLNVDNFLNLKSSLDRFIEETQQIAVTRKLNLKSSLDRFIVTELNNRGYKTKRFKIQFG